MKAFFHRHTLPDVTLIVIDPRHQIAARAESQLLERQYLDPDLDGLHFNAALWAKAGTTERINGGAYGITISVRHGINLPPVGTTPAGQNA